MSRQPGILHPHLIAARGSQGHQGESSQVVTSMESWGIYQRAMQPVQSPVAKSDDISVPLQEVHNCHKATHERNHPNFDFFSHTLLRVPPSAGGRIQWKCLTKDFNTLDKDPLLGSSALVHPLV